MLRKQSGLGILIVFNTPYLYGMERSVIETFDLVRPEVTPHFLMSYTTYQENLPLLAEVKRRGLPYSFFRDKKGWPGLQKPTSFKHFWQLMLALFSGNLTVLKASTRNEVLYVPSVRYFYFAFFAALYYRLAGKRIIYHFHDLIRVRSKQLRFVSFFITDFVHNTRTGRDTVISANPYVSRKRNYILPCPTAIRSNGLEEPASNLNLENRRSILFVGQVSRHKGVEVLIKAFNLLTPSQDNVSLDIVGGCSNSQFREVLQQMITSEGDEIQYWGYRTDISGFLKRSWVYVQPSLPSICQESFGRSVVEAMSAGVPAVCFRSGALQEIVVHEETGLICEEESAECLAENLRRFLDDADLRNQCGKRAFQRYEEYYSDDRVRESWLQLFN
jgi:glycosyltransferase involved in cell wall biosynthesis